MQVHLVGLKKTKNAGIRRVWQFLAEMLISDDLALAFRWRTEHLVHTFTQLTGERVPAIDRNDMLYLRKTVLDWFSMWKSNQKRSPERISKELRFSMWKDLQKAIYHTPISIGIT